MAEHEGGERSRHGSMNASTSTLYRENAPALLRFFRRKGPGGEAEDLVQETFARVLRRPGDLSGARSPRAWIFGIARHVAADAWRRVERDRKPPELEWPPPPRPQDARVEDLCLALRGLSPALQAPLRLRLAEDCSYQEIADRLGIPVGTVRSRLHNALKELRSVLRTREGESS